MNRLRKLDALFEPVRLQNVILKNRLIRSATYEGYGDPIGIPKPKLASLYQTLAEGGVGTIITGFVFVSRSGRAMQPGQCGIDDDVKTPPWREIADRLHTSAPDTRLFMQLAHAGRQTKKKHTGSTPVGASSRKCTYFKEPVKPLDNAEILTIVDEFGNAALRARDAGFDGVQVHAAHGYLIHQFLSPWTNTRSDKWADGPLLLEHIIDNIREKCSKAFPITVKLSWADDNTPGISINDTIQTVKRLEALNIDAVEISYGTMEFALNIIRGACPVDTILKVNPLFSHIPPLARSIWKKLFLERYLRRFTPFSENYNVDATLRIAATTSVPVFPVGGIRTVENAIYCLNRGLPAICLCRPLICEPDFPKRLREGKPSQCTNCNLCTAYCDSTRMLRCYHN